jgi:hypothetical protein
MVSFLVNVWEDSSLLLKMGNIAVISLISIPSLWFPVYPGFFAAKLSFFDFWIGCYIVAVISVLYWYAYRESSSFGAAFQRVYEIGGQAVFFWLGVGMVLLGMSIFFKVNARNK